MTRKDVFCMKKLVSYLLTAAMLFSVIGVSADSGVTSPSALTMQQVLVAVKEKINIPSEADKFESNSSTDDDGTVYDFSWHNDARTIAIDIECDDKAHIKSYNIYRDNNGDYSRLSTVTKEQAMSAADEFIKKAVPEAFQNSDDCFVYDEKSSGAYLNFSNSEYWFSYIRVKDGAKVKSNDARVQTEVYGDKVEVTSFSCEWDYKTEFEPSESFDGDLTAKYIEQFPVELVYEKEYPWIVYRADGKEETKAKMIYRIKDNDIGYISASTGEKVIEDPKIYRFFAENSTGDAAGGANAKSSQTMLTEAELKEIDNVKNLVSAQTAEKLLRSLGELKLSAGVKLVNSSVRTDGEKYYLSLHMSMDENAKINPNVTKYHNLYAMLDAQSGEILSLSNYTNGSSAAKELSAAEKQKAAAAVESFAKKVAGEKFSDCGDAENSFNDNYVGAYYPRFVNGIEYVNDGISIGYDAITKTVNNYNINWDDDVSYFELPDNAVTADEAYKAILSELPLEKIYIVSDGKYRLCATVPYDEIIKVDAVKGELIKNERKDNIKAEYDDISGHWSETAVKSLANVGIALSGDSFRPDDNISVGDMMRLMASSFYYGNYAYYDDGELIKALADRGIITRDEADSIDLGAAISREDAFAYMIKFMGYEKIAKMNNIFKCDFADKNLLSNDKIGCAALLSGFGVVAGDGGELRPNSYLTRAETAVMIYNYLTKN